MITHKKGFKFHAQPQTGAYSCSPCSWKDWLDGIFFGLSLGSFSNRRAPFRFCKLVSKILYLFLAEKWSFVLFCKFFRFWLTFFKTLYKRETFCSLREGLIWCWSPFCVLIILTASLLAPWGDHFREIQTYTNKQKGFLDIKYKVYSDY